MLLYLKVKRMESIELSKRFYYGEESVNSNEVIGGLVVAVLKTSGLYALFFGFTHMSYLLIPRIFSLAIHYVTS